MESETQASNATSLGILTLIRTQSPPEPQVSPRDQLELAHENLEAELLSLLVLPGLAVPSLPTF